MTVYVDPKRLLTQAEQLTRRAAHGRITHEEIGPRSMSDHLWSMGCGYVQAAREASRGQSHTWTVARRKS